MTRPSEIFSKIPSLDYEEHCLPTSPQEFRNILLNRRSVRVFSEDKIPTEIMEEVLEWGLLAPNSSNLQPWEFYWVQDSQKKADLRLACFNQPAARTAQEMIVCVARIDRWKMIRLKMLQQFDQEEKTPKSARAYYEKLVPFIYSQGPLGFFGCLKAFLIPLIGLFRPVPREPTNKSEMKIWAVKSTALACQNIMNGFSAHGFDTCPLEGFDSKMVKKILKIPSSSQIVMIIAAGKRSSKGVYGPRIRMEKDLFIKKI